MNSQKIGKIQVRWKGILSISIQCHSLIEALEGWGATQNSLQVYTDVKSKM